MSKGKVTNDDLFAPYILEQEAGPWTIIESVLDEASVDLHNRVAKIPRPGTEAQQLARMHEAYHTKISPRDWTLVRNNVLAMGDEAGIELDVSPLMVIAKMLEENRVDWRLWDRHNIDMRPCREMLDWGKMTIPDDPAPGKAPLEACIWVLQLAWTVWASEGFPAGKVPNPPDPREQDQETLDFFAECWRIVQEYDIKLARALVSACLNMYNDPTHEMRDRCTFEIATFFPVEPPPPPPPEKAEEKEEQAELEKELADLLDSIKDDASGGDSNGVEKYGHWEVHDHTRGRRRPVSKIRRTFTAMDTGQLLKYPHRFYLDKRVFGRRFVSEGSLMIDYSGSMSWSNEEMLFLLSKMPNIWISSYSGARSYTDPKIIGRICIHAKRGVFNEFTGKEGVNTGGNDIDWEALNYLGHQPEPRFWLSDGEVVGGFLQSKPNTLPGYENMPALSVPPLVRQLGALIHACNETMKRYRILRVPDQVTMRDLVQGRRVTLYKTVVGETYKAVLPTVPVQFQL